MTLNLAERVVNHHHCKKKVHTEPSRKKESCYKSPNLPLLEHRREIKKQFIRTDNLVSHTEGHQQSSAQIVPCHWRYFLYCFFQSFHFCN
jgi:hypothetical protein